MTLLAPLGMAALLLSIPIVILHMLTPRRPPTPVSSLLHWDGLRHSITAAEPWQKLRWSLLLILQLLAVVLFALALSRPARVEIADLASHTVFIVDGSGSMSAIDGKPDRLADAVARTEELREEMPEGGAASIVLASASPAVLLEESADPDAFRRALASITTVAGRADYESAFALAESLVSAERPTGFVLLSDGGLDEVEQRLAPLGTRFEAVGETDTNRAITDLSVTAGPGGLQARVTMESTGGPDATQVLRMDVDGVTADRREVTIPSGRVVEEVFELPLGEQVAAYLDGEDLVGFDNQRFVSAPLPGTLKVRVHGESAFFIEQLLSAIPDVDRDVAPGEEVDFEIYAGEPVPLEPTTPFIAIDVPGGAPGITATGRIDDPIPTLVTDDPLLEDVDVSRIAIADAQVLDIESGEVLLGAPGAPLIVRGEVGGLPFFYIAFTLEQSNLPVNVAFPIIGSRMVGELASAEGGVASLTVGDRIPVDAGGEVIDPRGTRQVVPADEGDPMADQAGFWTVSGADGTSLLFAVNADTDESRLAPVDELPGLRPAPDRGEAAGAGSAEIARTLLPWVIAALLAVLALEYWVSRRNRGVSARQWRIGSAVRLVIVGLLVLALVNPIFTRSDDTVTTVFVVDVSDSLGGAVDEARAWVEAALADAGEARWAVVEVGGDARVAAPVGDFPYFPSGDIDVAATNLGRGLRLGESLLNGETKERIVLVSDGRSNSGDIAAEVERLEALGIQVDVHTIQSEVRTDAAVASIDVPTEVGEGESFDAEVEVISAVTIDGEVELLADGVVVGSQRATLQPGSNTFTFPVEAGEPGLQNLTARVAVAGDETRQNDSTSTALQVQGPDSVLLVEGAEGDGEILGSVLESRGLVVETTALESLPGVQELSAHQAVVMVDVNARDITESAMRSLDTFVRDLGRGLVVVGGEDSFALGEYQGTDLEALLPVDSEAQDAEREATVAEVLLIDTSESMGACHCSEEDGAFMESTEGGVNKTDIAKAAATRAFEALTENDEIGLLAFSGGQKWVVPLQQLPSSQVINEGIGSLRPFGETRIIPALEEAAESLRSSSKELKHIILFSDGFTSELDIEGFGEALPGMGDLVEAARALAEEGITVSVVGTGEGAIGALEEVAIAGNGRFYPGRDLNEIPEIFVKEARLAARSFINEGEFYPSVTSTSAAVRDLASSPPLLGFVATTAKPTADIQLQIGEFADPLLASWRVGLGQVTAWTSDAGEKWAAQWAGWDGYADFWSNVIRETFPLSGSAGQRLDASIADEVMTITLESAEAWPVGTSPTARVGYPDGTSEEVRLERTSDLQFAATVPARQGGAYAVGVGVENAEGDPVVMSAIASRSFAAEYLPGEADPALLESISHATGGLGEILAADAFDGEGLEEGVSESSLRWWFLLAAALLWPVDVALRRLRLSRREPTDRPPRSPGRRSTPASPEAAQTH